MHPDAAEGPRAYSVHAADEAPSRAHMIEGRSFEDAALGFLADWGVEGEGDEARVMVEDCETGERHCFRVDLGGEVQPCD